MYGRTGTTADLCIGDEGSGHFHNVENSLHDSSSSTTAERMIRFANTPGIQDSLRR